MLGTHVWIAETQGGFDRYVVLADGFEFRFDPPRHHLDNEQSSRKSQEIADRIARDETGLGDPAKVRESYHLLDAVLDAFKS